MLPAQSPTYNRLLTGHFREGVRYGTTRPHGTEDWLLIWTVAGAGRFGLPKGGQFIASPGEAVLLAPRSAHDYGTAPSAGKWELLWVHFLPRADWPRDFLRGWPAEGHGIFRSQPPAERQRHLAKRLEQAHRLALGAGGRATERALNALEDVLLELDALYHGRGTHPADERVLRVTELLRQDLQQALRWADIARTVGLSPSRLAHLFSDQIGCPPARYLEQQRMHRARLLLENTTRTVAEVALEVGFEDPFYFSHRFHRHAGISPRNYRRRYSDPR